MPIPATPIRQPNPAYAPFGPIPEMLSSMTFREVGSSGLRQFGGYVREEFLPQLQGRQGATIYREMSDNSPVIGGLMAALNATMRKVEWRTEPANDTPAAQEAAEFADSLRTDMSETWEDTLSDALSMLVYGYAPLEIVYKKRLGQDAGPDPDRPGRKLPSSKFNDGRIGWKKLALRGQDTVIKWFFDENGEVLGLTQQPYVGPLLDVPIEKLLLFRPTEHKQNPEGRSVLRNAYRPYYLAKRMEEQEAILSERMSGLPVLKVPSQLMEAARMGDPGAVASMNLFKSIAINLRIDEQMGVVLPSDTIIGSTGPTTIPAYSLELVAPGGNGGRASGGSDVPIRRHQDNMLMSAMADFLSLGHGATGTQALAVSKTDMFFQATEGYLNSMAAVFNRHGLARVWPLNGLDPDLLPEYKPDLAQRIDLDVLSNYVLRLAQSGMALFPSATLETALLDIAGLPTVEDSEADANDDDVDPSEEATAIVGPAAAANMPEPPAPIIAAPGAAGGRQAGQRPPPGAKAAPGARHTPAKQQAAKVAKRVINRLRPRAGALPIV